MDEAPPRWAAETEVIRRLETEWRAIADSSWLRRRLEVWASEDPRLAFEDGHRLLEAAQARDASSWADRDQVLSALLDRFEGDPVARRVTLQLVLPGVKSLIDGVRGWDVEERAARWWRPRSRCSLIARPNRRARLPASACLRTLDVGRSERPSGTGLNP